MTTGRRVWVNLYGHTLPGEFEMANTDGLADVDDRRNGHGLPTLVRSAAVRERKRRMKAAGYPGPRGVEVGVAVPIGSMVPLAIAAAVLVGDGVLIGQRFQPGPVPADHLVVRVIDTDAAGGPAVLSTQIVPLY